MKHSWTDRLIRWRLLLVLLLPVLAVLAAQGASRLGFSTDYRAYFSDSNPQLLAFEQMQSTYDKSDNLMIVVAPQSGSVFDAQALDAMRWITEQAWQTPYSVRVDSYVNFQRAEADGDTIHVDHLVPPGQEVDAGRAAAIRAYALAEPQLVGRLVSRDGAVAAVNVTYQLPGKSPFENGEIVGYARKLQAQVAERYPGLTVHLTGMAMYNNAFLESAMGDSARLMPLMYGVLVLIGVVVLRSLLATACAVVVVYLSVGAATGIAGWLGMSLTSLSASAPLVILTICIADSVHILAGVLRHMREGKARLQALSLAMQESAKPVVVTSVLNAAGFLALNFNEMPPFRDLGNIVAIGIACAMVLSLTLLPALVALLPLKPRGLGRTGFGATFRSFGDWVGARSSLVLWMAAPVAALLVAMVGRNEFNDQYIKWFAPETAFRQANDFTMARLTGLYSIEYSLRTDSPNGVAKPGFLADVDRYVAWLREQPEVVHVSSVTDTFKRINRSLNGEAPEAYRLPSDGQVAAQSLLLYEMSLPYGLDLNNQINVQKNATRVVATLRDLSTSEMLELERRSMGWLAAHAPEVDRSTAASTTLMFAHIGERNIHGMLTGMLSVAVFVSFCLTLVFRSLRVGLLAMVFNILPIAMAFGAWGLAVGQLGFSVAIVASVTLGIVVDDTVHFLYAAIDAMRQRGLTPRAAVAHAAEATGGAILSTTVILLSGFLVLGMSSFALNRDMGLMTALTLAIAALLDLLLLPALIIKLMEKRHVTTQGLPHVSAALDRR
ncbi:efflux RND transporter permease subunit [Aquabacterium sp. A7-Y]|uniref:efflux RND transporter permease subunit n=1 Tax=Aquabacterium sp. A7-Y TaxID=1349605 RepID=UPI00223DF363|nr:efflux RND transporter permease subunit [Aquabacterium sp. A7-Y]MCW7536893.1 efflux RND transporter permease subunit [Aquabacterium sp. A7-Y]